VWLKERDLAETTYERYEGILRNHLEPTLGGKPLAEIKEATIRTWRRKLLDNGVGEPTVAKAYRLIHAVFATAVDDGRMKRDPCRIGAFTSLRLGEFAALRRRDVDLNLGELRVRRSQAELKGGRTVIKGPKSEAGKRRVAIPSVIMADLRRHVEAYAEAGRI